MPREQQELLVETSSTPSNYHSADEMKKSARTVITISEWKSSDKWETVRTLVFSLLFLIVGFSIFLFFLHQFGLLQRPQPPHTRTTLKLTRIPSTNVPQLSGKCELGYRNFAGTGFCYKKFLHEATFIEAQKVCEDDKGNLVSIHSEAENEFVAEMIRSNTVLKSEQSLENSTKEFWIGLHNVAEFEWTDGTAVDFEKWIRAVPTDILGRQAAMISSTSKDFNPNGDQWTTFEPYTKQRGFICKKLPVINDKL